MTATLVFVHGAEIVDIDAGHDVAAEAPEALATILDDLARR